MQIEITDWTQEDTESVLDAARAGIPEAVTELEVRLAAVERQDAGELAEPYAVHEHNEIGPVLTQKGHHFKRR